jgi:flagella basal body P-ring formation protein FlgA
MGLFWPRVLIAVCAPVCATAAPSPAIVHVARGDTRSLQRELILVAQKVLPAWFVVDGEGAWLSLSGPLPAADTFEARPLWSVTESPPTLPLLFELRGTNGQPIRASLSVRLLQEVLMATRRLRKGSMVSRDDLGSGLRDVRYLPRGVLSPDHQIGAHVVALRDIAAKDVVRSSDIGTAPAVAAGMRVRVSASSGAISVSTTAIALADAQVGDQIDIRLARPTRTLRARVIAPGSVQPADEQP